MPNLIKAETETQISGPAPADTPAENKFWRRLREPGKQVFWIWVAYQAVKGTLTTTFIWIPALYIWLHSS